MWETTDWQSGCTEQMWQNIRIIKNRGGGGLRDLANILQSETNKLKNKTTYYIIEWKLLDIREKRGDYIYFLIIKNKMICWLFLSLAIDRKSAFLCWKQNKTKCYNRWDISPPPPPLCTPRHPVLYTLRHRVVHPHTYPLVHPQIYPPFKLLIENFEE